MEKNMEDELESEIMEGFRLGLGSSGLGRLGFISCLGPINPKPHKP